jgi:hypothetical protein
VVRLEVYELRQVAFAVSICLMTGYAGSSEPCGGFTKSKQKIRGIFCESIFRSLTPVATFIVTDLLKERVSLKTVKDLKPHVDL